MAYASFAALLAAAEKSDKDIARAVLIKEAEEADISQDEVREKMAHMLEIMRKSTTHGLDPALKSRSGLSGGDAAKVYARNHDSALLGGLFNRAVSYALATAETNSSMGRIVAAPTGGASGVLPGVILSVGEEYGKSDDDLIDALLVASGIGACYAAKATLSGAAGGCQAEIGTGASMAAAAITYMLGGDNEAIGHAASLAMQGLSGLVCDPVAGLVEIPCIVRNATGAAVALSAAEMALAGVKFAIPLDEVIVTAARVGAAIPITLRETAKGGLAVSPTGLSMKESLNFED